MVLGGINILPDLLGHCCKFRQVNVTANSHQVKFEFISGFTTMQVNLLIIDISF